MALELVILGAVCSLQDNPVRQKIIMDWLIERFQSLPQRTAFIHEGRKVSYGAMVVTIKAFRSCIETAGIHNGETVVVMGDYSPEVFCMMMALATNGSIVIPMTNNSVVEESAALDVTGCDWYIKFDADGINARINRRGQATENLLLANFRGNLCRVGVIFVWFNRQAQGNSARFQSSR